MIPWEGWFTLAVVGGAVVAMAFEWIEPPLEVVAGAHDTASPELHKVVASWLWRLGASPVVSYADAEGRVMS